MGGHERGDACADGSTEREKLPAKKRPAGAAHDGQLLVGVRVRVAVAGEMLSDGEDSGAQGAALERDPKARRGFRVASESPVADHGVFRVAVHVQHGREVDVDPDGRKFQGDRRARRLGRPFGVTAEQGVASRGGELREARILEPCDPAPFLVDGDQRGGTALARRGADLPAQFPHLLRPFQVAGEEDDASRRAVAQPRGQPMRDGLPLEPCHQERRAPGLFPQMAHYVSTLTCRVRPDPSRPPRPLRRSERKT